MIRTYPCGTIRFWIGAIQQPQFYLIINVVLQAQIFNHRQQVGNRLRIAGKKAAFLTLVGDCLKGLIPVLVARLLETDHLTVALTAFAAFIGHCFPVFFQFRGGKGVATAIAGTVAFDWVAGALLIGIWLLFAKVFRISSLAAIISFCALPLLIYWRFPEPAVTGVFVLLSAILIWRHRGNIQRLLQGNES